MNLNNNDLTPSNTSADLQRSAERIHFMDRSKIESIIYEKGYKDIKWISGADVVVSHWPRFKCMYGCSSYGKKGSCPPSVPSVDECREFFKELKT
jgi:predicted metal-binding protein